MVVPKKETSGVTAGGWNFWLDMEWYFVAEQNQRPKVC